MKQCEDLFSSLLERVRDRIESEQEEDIPSLKSLNEDWALLRKFYYENASGLAKYEVLAR